MIFNYNNNSKLLTCLECQHLDCFNPEKVKYCTNSLKCYKISARDSTGQDTVSRGCDNDGDGIQYCFSFRSQYIKEGQYAIECCNSDLCNNGSFPILPSMQIDDDLPSIQDEYDYFIVYIGLLILVCLLTVSTIIWLLRREKKRKLADRSSSFDLEVGYIDDVIIQTNTAVGDSTLKGYLEQSITSGSGFGLPLLMQRTLAKQIVLKDLVGKGKYGEVWRGIRNNAEVAVKIFLSKDEASWTRETEIYNSVLAKHPNILVFIGSDMTSRNSSTQLWLVTDYHRDGSLYDYLITHELDYSQMFRILCSIVNGVNHLHTDLSGYVDKPRIAHRDLKSKNILVKNDGECCIADFGLAVIYFERTGLMKVTPNPRVGTKRYMAPEVLHPQQMNTNSFESYKRADIYSLGLVFWEICTRTVSNGNVEDYHPPFYDCVNADPSFDEMHDIVYSKEQRPIFPDRWESDKKLIPIMKITTECWHQQATVRPSSLNIKKKLDKLKIKLMNNL